MSDLLSSLSSGPLLASDLFDHYGLSFQNKDDVCNRRPGDLIGPLCLTDEESQGSCISDFQQSPLAWSDEEYIQSPEHIADLSPQSSSLPCAEKYIAAKKTSQNASQWIKRKPHNMPLSSLSHKLRPSLIRFFHRHGKCKISDVLTTVVMMRILPALDAVHAITLGDSANIIISPTKKSRHVYRVYVGSESMIPAVFHNTPSHFVTTIVVRNITFDCLIDKCMFTHI